MKGFECKYIKILYGKLWRKVETTTFVPVFDEQLLSSGNEWNKKLLVL